ncbi:hypothetical protein J5N97_025708 [Dioscorea zingiberensis]|uniref:Protein EARLY HEADING DATE 2 n=1 Tax=Dioscorea zingiberensis TaxID=325984 RepID=A0A9D5C1A1_9LILI|nr:hypothetical protein J5N97_025708 [Dioscorea zingiberensis]
MMKGFIIQQNQVDENMSNLTSASGEASNSSNQQQSSFVSPNPNPVKKKRSLPGNPDPDAEVIALSPKTLMATNRFVCEICNKGFQRDQNLQLHRRGHNLPWKLKQRTSKEVRKKVYICPEVSCVHHDPSRALGDLTGIKKHFSRKHGEKKWKCDKCSKKYAVQSDWKAHSKICGTREYRCDCGTLFSRRDSFITHRAFCDALAEESARAITAINPMINHNHHHHPLLFTHNNSNNSNSSHEVQELSLKREQQQFNNMRGDQIPPWLACQGGGEMSTQGGTIFSATRSLEQDQYSHENQGPVSLPSPYQSSVAASPHMSATALLQKAAQMGATMSRPSIHGQMASATSSTTVFGLGLSSNNSVVHQEMISSGFARGSGSSSSSTLLQDMMLTPLPQASGFDGSFEEAFGGFLGSKKEENKGCTVECLPRSQKRNEEVGGHVGTTEGLTRDFLGLRGRALSQRDILNMAALDSSCMSSSYEHPHGPHPHHPHHPHHHHHQP